MTQARAETTIDAPIYLVWEVMLDVARYPEWNPFTEKVDCPQGVREGAPIDLHVRWGDGSGLVSHEKIVRILPPTAGADRIERASFEYNFGGPLAFLNLVRSHRVQALERLGDGRTRYTTTIELTGLLAGFAPIAKVQDGFDRQTAALKARAEAVARLR